MVNLKDLSYVITNSYFFPPEINMPLQNMFLYVIQEQCQEYTKQWERMEKFIDGYGINKEDEEARESYLREIAHYGSENFWQTFWEVLKYLWLRRILVSVVRSQCCKHLYFCYKII